MGLVNLLFLFFLFFGVAAQTIMYDFEEATVPTEISTSGGSTMKISIRQKNDGNQSLEWESTRDDGALTWNLSSKGIAGKVTRRGGVKVWIYQEEKLPGKCLSFCFRKIQEAMSGCAAPTGGPSVVCFPLSLDFTGWRAAWVSYSTFKGCPSPLSQSSHAPSPNTFQAGTCYDWKIDQLVIKHSAGVSSLKLNFDLLRFVNKVNKESRDLVVPPLTFEESGTLKCTSCGKIHHPTNGLTEADFLRLHLNHAAHWEEIYRWGIKTPSPTPATIDAKKLSDLTLITRRLTNWYANENTAYEFESTPPIDFFLRKRWISLKSNTNRALENMNGLYKRGLFSRKSDIPGEKKTFGWVFHQALLPYTLYTYIASRPIDVNHTACIFAKQNMCAGGTHLNADMNLFPSVEPAFKNHSRSRILKYARPSMSTPSTSCTEPGEIADCFKKQINNITARIEAAKGAIVNLFDYIKEQGFDKGSAYGSVDHEGLSMSGFAHSMFLMRKDLQSAGKLNGVIDTMKWYTYFGDVYQQPYEYKGTSADKIRAHMLYRLLTVLAMPETNDQEKKEKIRDMDALKRWIENALAINEGLYDFIKPDFTLFHHKSFYGSAYSPSAIHVAALICHLLHGTEFQLNGSIRNNVLKALEVYRIVAVRYSTPSYIGGRFPKYFQATLAQHVPAFAYMAANPPGILSSGALGNITLNTAAEVGMFLRMFEHTPDTCIGTLNKQLCNGEVERIYYLNTLGSLEIMNRVKYVASANTLIAEASPKGNWFKPFGAMSIHRRDDWAVTVRGFDKYIYDYEDGLSKNENLYGMYASHGAMLIANSESALCSKDVDGGWNWRKIPGTTVISLDYSDMLNNGGAHYNNDDGNKGLDWDTMAGGVSMTGSNKTSGRNGVFGMNFVQPAYRPGYIVPPVDFRFKKSVFFYDDIIVSLGSNITFNGTKEIHTSLFQDKMPSDTSCDGKKMSTFVKQNVPAPATTAADDVFRCNEGAVVNTITSWNKKTLVKLVDVHGNRYYIPHPDKQGLVFTRNKVQTSVKSRGKNVESTGTYCTAWLNHGSPPLTQEKARYEYVVQVDAEPSGGAHKPVRTLSDIYSVVKQDHKAHVVKFESTTTRSIVHGYVVFPQTLVNVKTGPVRSFKFQSITMVEETPSKLYISVAYPQLDLGLIPGSPSWCSEDSTNPITYQDVGQALRFCASSKEHKVSVRFRGAWTTLEAVKVGGEDKFASKDEYVDEDMLEKRMRVKFNKLRNGKVTEVEYIM